MHIKYKRASVSTDRLVSLAFFDGFFFFVIIFDVYFVRSLSLLSVRFHLLLTLSPSVLPETLQDFQFFICILLDVGCIINRFIFSKRIESARFIHFTSDTVYVRLHTAVLKWYALNTYTNQGRRKKHKKTKINTENAIAVFHNWDKCSRDLACSNLTASVEETNIRLRAIDC